jgi:hypothetical protein
VVLFGQTDMTKLTVAFRNFAYVPEATQRNQKAANQWLELSLGFSKVTELRFKRPWISA